MREDLVTRVLRSERYAEVVRRASLEAIYRDLPVIEPERLEMAATTDWSHGLLCASLLVGSDSESAQESILRVCQMCALSPTASPGQRAAALELLERAGNRRARDLVSEEMDAAVTETGAESAQAHVPLSLRLDSFRARLEYTVVRADGTELGVNRFQRRLWERAESTQWLSVSAPTSAGKSFIVRQWIADRLGQADALEIVYVVPTRALIEEVASELRADLSEAIGVHTLPWDAEIGTRSHEVFVFTQERLHLILEEDPLFAPQVAFIDEAQKFGDDSRGVLLQRVLDECSRRDPDIRVLMASPLSDNPEVLLESAPSDASAEPLIANTVTVPQNLFWVDQVPRKPKEWRVTWVSDEPEQVGTLELSDSPSPASIRLPSLAVALAKDGVGSVVYVNGPAEAEKVALQLHSLLAESLDLRDEPRIQALKELVTSTVHPSYALDVVLDRGVAFHYGNMPHLLRAEIEALFREGVLRYLVCTSTLLEGVNLPCRNLFVRGPKRGPRPMSQADFWNLAGRAGRWGKELQGNIFCVDTEDENRWPEVPRERVRYPLVRATQQALAATDGMLDYLDDGARAAARSDPPFESVFSYASSRLLQGSGLDSLPGFRDLPDADADALEAAIRGALVDYELPSDFASRHAGLSPLGLQRLLEDFRSYDDPAKLLISPPESPDAAESLVSALGRLVRAMDAPFGRAGQTWVYAILVVDWMRGLPLARLIANRINWKSERSTKEVKVASEIRDCMRDVEQLARFEAPRYLAAYVDVLHFHLTELGIEDQMPEMPDLAMMLELGVSRVTEMNLMSLGLSRTSVVALAEFIAPPDLDAEAALAWLQSAQLDSYPLPRLVRREIDRVLERSS